MTLPTQDFDLDKTPVTDWDSIGQALNELNHAKHVREAAVRAEKQQFAALQEIRKCLTGMDKILSDFEESVDSSGEKIPASVRMLINDVRNKIKQAPKYPLVG